MKQLFPLLFLLLMISSCGSDDNTPEPDPEFTNTFSAKIAGADFNPESITSSLAEDPTILSLGGATEIEDGNNPDISIFLYTLEEGTYDVLPGSDWEDVRIQYASDLWETFTIYQGISGNVTVSSHDEALKQIQGSFNFIGANFSDTISITEGQFHIEYE